MHIYLQKRNIFHDHKNANARRRQRNLTEHIEISPEKGTFLIDTIVCKIPEVDPFDNSIKHMINMNPGKLDCSKNEIEPYIQDGILYANLEKVKGSNSYCQYTPIFRDGIGLKLGGKSFKFKKNYKYNR